MFSQRNPLLIIREYVVEFFTKICTDFVHVYPWLKLINFFLLNNFKFIMKCDYLNSKQNQRLTSCVKTFHSALAKNAIVNILADFRTKSEANGVFYE